ncbi:translation initiation factor IF-2 [Tunicatimonas pelagia]|uniref:translation initiation factor IF-2 n=1 Tax=Tunicatimonas pelagia TaxID=931531 RepID=UPI00266708CF|nr:translation initiation factor IF-2 [Tunicatimonas pelagia]WKN45081.1 translation initiation factor IF-2 [Tunicatimonas pelagia]
MVEEKTMRLSQVARKFNVGRNTIVEFLSKKGFDIDRSPNAKIPKEQYDVLAKEFASSAMDKEEASALTIGSREENQIIDATGKHTPPEKQDEEELFIKKLESEKASREEKQDTESKEAKVSSSPAEEEKEEKSDSVGAPKLQGLNVLGKIDLDEVGSKKKAKPTKQKEEAKKTPKVEAKKEEPSPTVEPAVKEEAPPPVPQPKDKEEAPQQEIPQQEAQPKEEVPTAKKAEVVEPEKKPEKADTENKETKKATNKEDKTADSKKPEEKKESQVIKAKADKLQGLNVVGKIELPTEPKKKDKATPVASSDERKKKRKRRRRIKDDSKPNTQQGGRQDNRRGGGGNKRGGSKKKEEISDKEVQEQIKETLARLSGGNKKRGKARQERRRDARKEREEQAMQEAQEQQALKVTEFISANDLASLMNVSVNEVISTCMSLGMFVSINQRLDAETITVIADEFGFEVEFVDAKEEIAVEVEEDSEEDLEDRAPIVTIMGHVDHGKTSLLDYIRSSKVTEGEAGGITQHIGAYDVTTESGKRIAFLDTPGHEAFTAMRARGAQVTDVVIIVVAADDAVMPQTKEAINHAQVAGVPIVIAINKIDRPNANADKIREELSGVNILVEEWGGKYQSQEISAKTGQGVDELLEKVLLESELLELKANPGRPAAGTVIEATLDRGRGYVTTLLVESGTMKIGDVILAGSQFGKVKAMFDHRGKKMREIPPATPVQMLGLDGAPQAGDKFNVMETDREAREIATKREQIQREQSLRTKKHITLDEIGRRLAIGSFRELNVIVKGDVDGSVEALSDSLLKLSTEEVQVNIIHKAVGQISESDVLLASASDAIIVGFQVRPSNSARNLAEKEEIEIRLYSIIYDAINEVRDAMEGMLAPTVEEVITGNIEVRQIFKISRVGTVAGCYVTDGTVKRNNRIRLVRDGIVAYTGEINQLKREKDDVSEVRAGFECGISIKNFNDIKVGDVIEGFEEKEVKRSL